MAMNDDSFGVAFKISPIIYLVCLTLLDFAVRIATDPAVLPAWKVLVFLGANAVIVVLLAFEERRISHENEINKKCVNMNEL